MPSGCMRWDLASFIGWALARTPSPRLGALKGCPHPTRLHWRRAGKRVRVFPASMLQSLRDKSGYYFIEVLLKMN